MRYRIAYMIKGETGYRMLTLANELADVFDLERFTRRIGPHISLKGQFEASEPSALRLADSLRGFAEKHGRFPIHFGKFNHFNRQVIYVEVTPNTKALDFSAALMNHLSQFSWMSFDRTDREKKFHATIAYTPKRAVFEEVWHYLRNESLVGDGYIDSLTLLRLEKNQWRLFDEFNLQV